MYEGIDAQMIGYNRGRTTHFIAAWLAVAVFASSGCNSGDGQAAPASAQGAQGAQGARGGAAGRGGRGAGGPTPVEVAVAELGRAARFIAATGTVEPVRVVGINSQASGALIRVAVEEGSVVSAGAVLAQIDSRELEAQLRSSTANLEVAKRAAERSQQLRDQQFNTIAEYERDQAAYAAARAGHEQIQTRLGYTTVRAPVGGIVLDKRVETGDIVSAQTRLFTIGDVSTLVVRVPVSELDVMGLKTGDAVTVTLDALPGQPVQGRIRRVFPSADTVTRLVPVEVALSGTSARQVRPGFLARVNIALDPRTNVLMVPAGALLQDPNGSVVYLVQGGKATRRNVRRGVSYQGQVEIVEGIAAGDTVIVAGNTMVREGSAVRVIDNGARDVQAVGTDTSGETPSAGETR